MNAYSYVLLRYVHDLSTGEFVNVGVVAYEQKSRAIAYRFKHSVSRVTSFFPGVKARNFRQQLRMLERAFSEADQRNLSLQFADVEDARRIALQVFVEDDSALQWSDLRTGISADFQRSVDSLFERLVNRYDEHKIGGSRRSDQDIWSSFSKSLPKSNVLHHLHERAVSSKDDEVVFEHAWKNGKWHCLEPMSLDLASAHRIKEKVHKCFGQLASLQAELMDHKIYFLMASPHNDALHGEYLKAKSILAKLPVESEIVEESEFPTFGRRLALDIERHEAGGAH